MEKKKNYVNDFSILSIDDMKIEKKTQICFVDTKILNNSQNTTIFTQSATLLRRDSNTYVFL